jgi:hypothetical protein
MTDEIKIAQLDGFEALTDECLEKYLTHCRIVDAAIVAAMSDGSWERVRELVEESKTLVLAYKAACKDEKEAAACLL